MGWLFLSGFLLIFIGVARLLVEYKDKLMKEEKSQDLLEKSEKLGKITDHLSRNWKS